MSLRIDWCDHSETDDAMVVVMRDSSLDCGVLNSLMILPTMHLPESVLFVFNMSGRHTLCHEVAVVSYIQNNAIHE
jgi:hypothetical protein